MKFNLPKQNIFFIIASLVIIVAGFCLMTGAPSGEHAYNPDIFSFRRITIGPMVALFGFVSMVVAILYKPRKK